MIGKNKGKTKTKNIISVTENYQQDTIQNKGLPLDKQLVLVDKQGRN